MSSTKIERLFDGYDPSWWTSDLVMHLDRGYLQPLSRAHGVLRFTLNDGRVILFHPPGLDEGTESALRKMSRSVLVRGYEEAQRQVLRQNMAEVTKARLALEGWPDWACYVRADLPEVLLPEGGCWAPNGAQWSNWVESGLMPFGSFQLNLKEGYVFSPNSEGEHAFWHAVLELSDYRGDPPISSLDEVNRLLHARLLDVQYGFRMMLSHGTGHHWLYHYQEEMDTLVLYLELLRYFTAAPRRDA